MIFLFQNKFVSLNTAIFGMRFASSVSHVAALVVIVPSFFRENCIFKVGRMKFADFFRRFNEGFIAIRQNTRTYDGLSSHVFCERCFCFDRFRNTS